MTRGVADRNCRREQVARERATDMAKGKKGDEVKGRAETEKVGFGGGRESRIAGKRRLRNVPEASWQTEKTEAPHGHRFFTSIS